MKQKKNEKKAFFVTKSIEPKKKKINKNEMKPKPKVKNKKTFRNILF